MLRSCFRISYCLRLNSRIETICVYQRTLYPDSVTSFDSEDDFSGRRLYHSVPVSANYKTMNLQEVTKRLHSLAATSLAEKWDNVGLLVEPTPPHLVKNILLTNDLTPPVLDEALQKGANMIISYHPPIFAPLKRLRAKNWKESLIVKCIENHVAVYSPHTSYDCVQGGINDWLIDCFDIQEKKPIASHSEIVGPYTHQLCAIVSLEAISDIRTNLAALADISMSTSPLMNDTEVGTKIDVRIYCSSGNIQNIISVLHTFNKSVTHLTCLELSKLPKPGYGMGRRATLNRPITLEEAVEKVKCHLGLDKVRLAAAPGSPSVSSVAVCAGSGGSLLKDVSASLFVTGEMSHHEILHAMYSMTSVIVCDHSNTERGYKICV
ncbi:hypothetical protein ACJMK2_011942 [Sinanodonta woodiana]|uniref:NIF3-like protein 1 n=1 Tax=Sinanodonta woodiana TaxID=1069815 RepID=A0ABD3V889_SINWO